MKRWLTLFVLLAAIAVAAYLFFSLPNSALSPSPTSQLPDGRLPDALDGLYGQRLTTVKSMSATTDTVLLEIRLADGFPGRTEPYRVLQAIAEDYPESDVRTLKFSGPVAPEANTLLYTEYIWDSSTGYFDYWEGSGPKPQELPPGVATAGAGMMEHLISATGFDDAALARIIQGESISDATSLTVSYPTRRTEDDSGR